MFIGIAGRLHSGKGEIATLFEKRGFVKLKFADVLKDLLCELYGLNREQLEKEKDVNKNLKFDHYIRKQLATRLNTKVEVIDTLTKNFGGNEFTNSDKMFFKSIRTAMQFVGTELIRNINPNWHINQMNIRLQEGQNYINDDLRFMNEKEFLQSKGAHFWYIIRPNLPDFSIHISERNLRWGNFSNILINENLELLKEELDKKIDKMIENNDFTFLSALPNYTLYEENETNKTLARILIKNGSFVTVGGRILFTYYSTNEKHNEQMKTLFPFIENSFTIDNPYILENIKYWYI